MRAGPVIVAASFLLAVLLSGCAGPGGQDAKKLSLGGDRVPVAGRVHGDDQIPVANASVLLTSRADNSLVARTQSDIEGAFTLGAVQPGEYVLAVQAPTFKPMTRNLLVQATESAALSTIKIQLDKLPVVEPFYVTEPKTLFIQVGVAYQILGDFNQGCLSPSNTCNAYADPEPNVQFQALDPPATRWTGLVLEQVWTPNSPVCAKSMAVDIYNPDAPSIWDPSAQNPHYWTNYPSDKWQLTSPVVITIPRDEDGNQDAVNSPERTKAAGGEMLVRGNWTVRNFPPAKGITNLPVDVNCFTDQKFDIYWTNFYLDRAPIDFTARVT